MRRTASLLIGFFCLAHSYGGYFAYNESLNLFADSIIVSGPTTFCQGRSVALTANFAPAGSTYQWRASTDNGNSWTNTGNQQAYTATSSGLYNVLVTSGGTTTVYPNVQVTALPKPDAAFTHIPSNACSSIPVKFTNTSSGTDLSYSWNFGDPNSGQNNTSTLVHPTHHFVGSYQGGQQNYTVTLITTNGAGCTDTTTQIITQSSPGTLLGGNGFTTYNGKPYFTQCASATSTFTFSNQNTGNSNYTIVWGDGSPNYTTTSFTTVTHSYSIGNYSLQFIVTGQNGCVDTGNYNVFVGSNPAVGFNNPGNTFICSGTSLTFPITGTENNPPGTIYTVTFNDGSPPTEFLHPAPPTITHLFTKGSCGTESPGYPNSFQATIKASNPCNTSAASVVPIYVSQKATALFNIQPGEVVCTNTNVTLNNISNNSFGVSSSGVCNPGKGIWEITPAVGWNIRTGSTGNDFDLDDPGIWDNGTSTLNINFTTPGTYRIKLKVGTNQLCNADSVVKTICVNPRPVAAFVPSVNSGCAPLTISTTNNSNTPTCGTNSYEWKINYSNTISCAPGTSGYEYLNGTNASSSAPDIRFNNPGTYTLTLTTKNSAGTCEASTVSTITVKSKPTANINAPVGVCQNGSITPTATVNNCSGNTPATYLWSFPGGNPATSTQAVPGPIQYNNAGSFTISLAVTNECGTVTVTKNLNVTAAPDVTVPPDQTYCAGSPTGNLSFSSNSNGVVYSWTNSNPAIGIAASGTGNIPGFNVVNNSALSINGMITVIPSTSCAGTPKSFTITVNPVPSRPGTISPLNYCLNAPASPLVATGTPGNILTWYNNAGLIGGSQDAPTPQTSVAGTTTWYVTQSNNFSCRSLPSTITVVVLPNIKGNNITGDQIICIGSSAAVISGGTVTGGNGSFTYQWQSSTDGNVWTNIPGAVNNNYSPGVLTSSLRFRKTVTSGSCSDTSNVVSITAQGNISNTDITAPQNICEGATPEILKGQEPSGGNNTFIYQWETSGNNSNWTLINGATGIDYQPPVLTSTTFYRRKTSSGSCTVYSSSVEVKVNKKPIVNPVTSQFYCHNSSTNTINFTSIPNTGVSFSWVNDNTSIGLPASGSGQIPSFVTANTSNPKLPVTANIIVTPTLINGNASCSGNSSAFRIVVLPSISIEPIPDSTVCTGTKISSFIPVHDAASGGVVNYSWGISGNGISLVSGTGTTIPGYTAINTGNTDLTATITITPLYIYNGKLCNGNPESYSITVKPGTGIAAAGRDTALCNASSYSIAGFLPAGNTGQWAQIGGVPATIENPSSPVSRISGLVAGNEYKFEWTVKGFASCPDSKDSVVVTVNADLTNIISAVSTTICAGQSINITGENPTGGNGVYQYQWQSSSDGVNWSVITNETASTLTHTPAQNVYLRRVVQSFPCSKASEPVHIIVQAALSNNTILDAQEICINTEAREIKGAVPQGGNNQFLYQWQQSTDGNVWNNIPGATGQHFYPGALKATTFYRRLASTDLCSGPNSSVSNTIAITVRPDALAVITPVTNIGCTPFTISSAIINPTPYPLRNRDYVWYADGNLLGYGFNFPGLTLNKEDDSVVITMVAISAFDCRNDTVHQKFYTYKIPSPSFTVTDTSGCGPLKITITNTTPEANRYRFLWDFGNGLKSTDIQPGNIVYQPDLNFSDTTYRIQLKVLSACDTIVLSKNIHIKSKPKALFTPDKVVGCSPMTVLFSNTSLGKNIQYTWDFGDGSPLLNSSAGLIQHTYNTGQRDTFFVKLSAGNECGVDTLQYALVVSPNSIQLDFAMNGNEETGCTPHSVRFINNTKGATGFTWDFGDGTIINTNRNIDTVSHIYKIAGMYTVSLRATNGCADTSAIESIQVFPTPVAKFISNLSSVCIGDSIRFTNLSDSATSYLWDFDDGQTSAVMNPIHRYAAAGRYTVRLKVFRINMPGSICTDTVSRQIDIAASLTGSFVTSDTTAACAPFTVRFTNLHAPSSSAKWEFDDGSTATGDHVTHTFLEAGEYHVKLTVLSPEGCTYVSKRIISVKGPRGSFQYTSGFICNDRTSYFQVNATNSDTILYNFGDGTVLKTTINSAYHSYVNPGIYIPSVSLLNASGCIVPLAGKDTIKVDKITAGFHADIEFKCGESIVHFTDTSIAYFGKVAVRWEFGDGQTSTAFNVKHTYTHSGVYTIRQIIYGRSGCTDTITRQLNVHVKNIPSVTIKSPPVACAGQPVSLEALIQSVDSVNTFHWNISNGVTGIKNPFQYTFTQPGNYTLQVIASTVNGCYDTSSKMILIQPSPVVSVNRNVNICRGNTVQLLTTGNNVVQYSWSPAVGLSCTDCASPVASPNITTAYVVKGTNEFGCAVTDTAVVTVVQPMNLNISKDDSICVGETSQLLVSGASTYNWSPAAGLNNTTTSNPTATPQFTTVYRVVGYDGFNCFTDTGYITVAVGQPPTIDLGPDLEMPTGTFHQLQSTVTNGPVRNWLWQPSIDLNCSNCPVPTVHIKKDITYSVRITTAYGCSASDTINVKTFCKNTQLFIPNAFTPDGDGVNDLLIVRGSGITLVKTFRIFNRWGKVIFEKANFLPNDPAHAWNGKINGVDAGPDVFVFTAEVICENGTSYTYKGNVSIIK